MIVALAALAGREIKLEGDGGAHGCHGGFDRRLADERAAEIGVQHGSGEIEDGAQVRARVRCQPGQRRIGDGLRLARRRLAGAQRGARRIERLAHRRHRGGASEASDGKRRRIGL